MINFGNWTIWSGSNISCVVENGSQDTPQSYYCLFKSSYINPAQISNKEFEILLLRTELLSFIFIAEQPHFTGICAAYLLVQDWCSKSRLIREVGHKSYYNTSVMSTPKQCSHLTAKWFFVDDYQSRAGLGSPERSGYFQANERRSFTPTSQLR